MTERPILFSGPMVRAILSGAKTQTRRVVKPQPHAEITSFCEIIPGGGDWKPAWSSSRRSVEMLHSGESMVFNKTLRCPYGQPGDRLWVRETCAVPRNSQDREKVLYKADEMFDGCARGDLGFKWRPSIHMPRWASRIDLLVKDVRVERLQEISEEDAIAEGVVPPIGSVDVRAWVLFRRLWDSINAAKHPWSSNPWVWVVEFERVAP